MHYSSHTHHVQPDVSSFSLLHRVSAAVAAVAAALWGPMHEFWNRAIALADVVGSYVGQLAALTKARAAPKSGSQSRGHSSAALRASAGSSTG